MVVKDKLGAVDKTQQQRERPEDVRRVACLHDGEPPGSARLEREPRRGGERVGVLVDEAQLAAARGVRPVLMQLDRVDNLEIRITFALRADNGDVVAGSYQGLTFQPYPSVKWHRQILHDDQDATHQPIPS